MFILHNFRVDQLKMYKVRSRWSCFCCLFIIIYIHSSVWVAVHSDPHTGVDVNFSGCRVNTPRISRTHIEDLSGEEGGASLPQPSFHVSKLVMPATSNNRSASLTLCLLITQVVVFNLFYYQVKPQLLGIKLSS